MKSDSDQVKEFDRVRRHTRSKMLHKVDSEIEQRIRFYAAQPKEMISQRIRELEREWDMERWLEANASMLALSGVVLGATVNKKFLLLSGAVLGFLFQHSIQGWCPPIGLFRRLGVRTEREIDREKYALKYLRGDFDTVSKEREHSSELAKAVGRA